MTTESPREKAVRLYASTDMEIPDIMQETGVSRATLFRYIKLAGITPNRRGTYSGPTSTAPSKLGMQRRLAQQGLLESPETATAKFHCVQANCLPLEIPYIRALRFLPEQVQKSLDTLHEMRLTLISNCIGHPTGWGVWLVGPKYFSDPATNPAFPMTLEDCIGILEDPKGWVVANAPRIKEYTTKRREEQTQRVNDLISSTREAVERGPHSNW